MLFVYRAVAVTTHGHKGPAKELVLVHLRTAQSRLLRLAHSIVESCPKERTAKRQVVNHQSVARLSIRRHWQFDVAGRAQRVHKLHRSERWRSGVCGFLGRAGGCARAVHHVL
jgi:hypothetical protein